MISRRSFFSWLPALGGLALFLPAKRRESEEVEFPPAGKDFFYQRDGSGDVHRIGTVPHSWVGPIGSPVGRRFFAVLRPGSI